LDNTTTYAPPASRNAPCPCGSGRRWKECHGQVAAPSAAAVIPDALARWMHEALAAQRAGRLAEAIALYDAVIGAAPALFDAWHMRGVARFQALEFDAAEADIRRALAIEPQSAAARGNLDLVIEGRRIARDEEALCRAVLPRYRPLVVEHAVPPLHGVGGGTRVFVLDAAAHARWADALARAARDRGAEVVAIAVERGRAVDGANAAALAASGSGDVVVCVGCARPLGDWTLDARPRAAALVADGPDLAALCDRLRELSGQGRRQVRLAAIAGVAIDPEALPCHRGEAW
jgi:tetratricopeptide (TPR) repeat protein